MALIYITGLPGAGKTTVIHELKRRNLEAYSADEDGFNSWCNRITGEKHNVKPGEDDHTPEWDRKYTWKTDTDMVAALKDRSNKVNIFLGGVSANQDDLLSFFDKVIYLRLDERTLRHRLATRTNNDYGKASHELEGILHDHKTEVQRYTSLGAVIIDATQSVGKVVDDIIVALV